MYITFLKDSGWERQMCLAHTYRFDETPAFTQEQDHIRSAANPNHPEGFDNVSLLTRETCGVGAAITMRCSFTGLGCPEIMIIEDLAECGGAMRYGAGFEIALYENGFNVWRHYCENGQCAWHQRLGVEYPVAEDTVHTLTVRILENMLEITLNGQKTLLHTPDLPEKFHLGVTACEGIARIYDLEINP